MTPSELYTAAGAMRDAASGMSADAERYGDGARAAREPIGALQTVAAGPDIDDLAAEGRRFVDQAGDVPGLLGTAAASLRTCADHTEQVARTVARLEGQLTELYRERRLASSAASMTVQAADLERIDRELRDVDGQRDTALDAWRRLAGRVAGEVGDVDRQLSSVVRSLDAAALGRAAAAQHAVDTNKPLNRASARASQLWNSPVRQSAGRLLGRANVILGAGGMVTDVGRGDYFNAGLTGTSMIAAGLATAGVVPVFGAAVVVGTAVVQHREELASAGRWVKGKVKGLFGR